MKLTDHVVKNILRKLIKGEDYRIEVVTLIDAEFLQYAVDFFRKIIDAKIANQKISVDWYKKEFLHEDLSSDEIAIHSGLNKKTITNMYNSGTREVVLDASLSHYGSLFQTIKELTEHESDLELTLTLKYQNIGVELNINESLIVVNTLAVKRAALRGGLWSTAGKRAEKYLMITLCKIFNVPTRCYDQSKIPESMREVDFHLIVGNEFHRCEVKLMGKGNPESADAIFARESKVFIGDKLSDLNKKQAEKLSCEWVELRSIEGYKRFSEVLKRLRIPHKKFSGDIDEKLNIIFDEVFPQ